MAIRQESMIELIRCAKAWREAYTRIDTRVREAQAMASSLYPEAAHLFTTLIVELGLAHPPPGLSGPIDQYDLHYRMRQRGNLVRRHEMNRLAGEATAHEEYRAQRGHAFGTRPKGGNAPIVRPEDRLGVDPTQPTPASTPLSDKELGKINHGYVPPPEADWDAYQARQAAHATKPIDPFAGEPDPMTDAERGRLNNAKDQGTNR